MARDGFSATIDLENSDALLALDNLRRRQLPFAQALALTKTAQAAQKAIRTSLPTRFEIRNNFLERGVRIQAATKRNQQSAVFWRAPGGVARRGFAQSLARQETGGSKRPMKKYLAIPREANKRRGAGGRIPKRWQPAQVLKRKDTFVARAGSGLAIYRRRGKGRLPLETLYFLSSRQIKVPEAFGFVATARDAARKIYKTEFGRAFAKALATQKR